MSPPTPTSPASPAVRRSNISEPRLNLTGGSFVKRGMQADDEDFTRWVTGAYAVLARTALLLTGRPASAEDLLQESLLRTYRVWGRIDRGTATAYTWRVMTNLTTDWWRLRRFEPQPVAELPELGRLAGEYAGVDDRDLIVRALALLSARERAVVVLRYYADLPEREVASQLGISIGTVKSTASRALARIGAYAGGFPQGLTPELLAAPRATLDTMAPSLCVFAESDCR